MSLSLSHRLCPYCIFAYGYACDEWMHSSVCPYPKCNSNMFKVCFWCFSTVTTSMIDCQSHSVFIWIKACVYLYIYYTFIYLWCTKCILLLWRLYRRTCSKLIPWSKGFSAAVMDTCPSQFPVVCVVPQVSAQLPWLQDAITVGHIDEGSHWSFIFAHTITCAHFWQ